MKASSVELLSLSVVVIASGCQSLSYADRGATLGALTGALGGAAIGQHNGDAASGALIGTAVGALAGAAVGDTIDYEVARSAEIIEQRMGRRMAGAVAMNDVIAMSQAGLSEDVIMTHMRANGVASPPTVNDLITLRNAGVSDSVIQVMQQTPPPIAQVVGPPGPVIIEEHHYVASPFPYYGYHPHRHHPPHRPGVHWGVSFGH
ncbi:MAG: glycine zipper 2TM domain-containing protein [Planctomycetia bacterium]|nr:glycine zipper 2TM domain-containing protein [Planctomycetia bacterium]